MTDCPFCQLHPERVLASNEAAVALLDSYPITEGHTLVVPRKHVNSIYQLPESEEVAIWELVRAVREQLILKHKPDGFTIGINDGAAAGQTVPHAHVHIIPRYNGDVPDPRGGVRWTIPHKARYWDR